MVLENVVGPSEIVEQRDCNVEFAHIWPLITQWAHSLGLRPVDHDGNARGYERRRGVLAQIRHVTRQILGHPQLGETGPIQFTVTPWDNEAAASGVSEAVTPWDNERAHAVAGTSVTVTVDLSAQRETTLWTGGGIIVGGSTASLYLMNISSLWLWLVGIPVAGGIATSYFMDRKRAMQHVTELLQSLMDALQDGHTPPRGRDVFKQRLTSIERT